MEKRGLFSVLIVTLMLGAGAVPAFSIPSSFCDDSEGFIELNIMWSWDFSKDGFGFGAEFGGGGQGFWGLDFGAVYYKTRGTFIYIGGQYFLNPSVSDFYTIPVRLRVGAVLTSAKDVTWGVSALSGIRLYPLILRYSPEYAEDFALGAGAELSLNYWGRSLFAAAEADASLGLSLKPDTGNGYYYVYY